MADQSDLVGCPEMKRTKTKSRRNEAENRRMLRAKRELFLLDFEREAMRSAGRFNAQLMDHLRDYVRPGITTGEIDRVVHEFTLDHRHKPACLGYQGFPKSCCTSINDVVCHGIPGTEVLHDGDLVNIDVTSVVDGWIGDQSAQA